MKNAFLEEAIYEGKYLRECLDNYFRGEVPGLLKIKEMAETGKIKKVLLAGMGSSYYATNCVVSYLTQKGIPSLVLNGFEAARYQWEQVTEGTLVVGISQSGKSWELAELIEKVHDHATVVGIVIKADSRLESLSDIKLPLFAGDEVFFANRSFLNSLAVLNIMAHTIAQDDMEALKKEMYLLTDWVDNYIENHEALTLPLYEMAKNADMYDFLGDGPSMAAAYQGGIIFREGPAAKTASIMLADYAHDWILSVNESYTEILCVPDFTAEVEVRMYNRILENGGKAILITSNEEVQDNSKTAILRHPKFKESLAPMAQIVCMNFLLAYILGDGWHR